MKEWILENTDVIEEEYDNLINPYMIKMINSPKIIDNSKRSKLFSHPLIAIDKFTIGKQNKLKKIRYRVISEKNYYIHKDVKFYILAEILKEMHEIQETLYSKNRKGKCCELSIKIAAKLCNCRIVTAVCVNPFNEAHKHFLHTFILFVDDNKKEYIFDATTNTSIEKDIYYKLYQTKIISDIPKEKFTNDMKILYQANIPHLNMAEYFCFPEQVMKSAKKLVKHKS